MKPNRSRFSRFREILMLQSRRPPTPLPANSGPSDHASTEDDFFARFPVSGHWIDGTYFSRLIGSKSVTGHS
jgi:hypothetical protein